MNKLYIKKEIFYICVIGLCILSMIPILQLSMYDHPSADDYSYTLLTYAAWNDTHSIFAVIQAAYKTTIEFWNTWQGLYSSAFLLALQPAIFGEQYYVLTGFVTVGILYGSALIFSWYIIHRRMKGTGLEALTIGSVLAFLLIQFMPAIVEGIYWWNGALNYVTFWGIFLIMVCLVIGVCLESRPIASVLRTLLTTLLAFILSGGNHITAFLGILFVLGTLGYLILRRAWRSLPPVMIILIVEMMGFVLNITSPGTKVRQDNFLTRPGVLDTVKLAIENGCSYMYQWMGLALVLCMVILLPVILGIVSRVIRGTAYRFEHPLLIMILSIGAVCAMLCPPLYAMGNVGAGRLTNIVYFLFITLCLVNEIYLVGWSMGRGWIRLREDSDTGMTAVALMVLLVFFAVSCGRQTTVYQAHQLMVSGDAQTYDTQADERARILEKSQGEEVVLSNFSVHPSLLFFDDIEEDAANWKNIAMSNYYGLISVVRGE